ncbi:MAG: CRISPR-associated endonuclease Cas2 [Chlorobi bacterium]|nr:CRISPR-associated endonuclease Cas2 [Chlorobiota bacterium]
MEKLRQEYLISYDVEDNKARSRLYKELAGYGLRSVQKSVFWGHLSMAELQAVKRELQKYLDAHDKAFITHSSFNGRGQSYFIGHDEEDFKDWKENHVI